MCVRIRECFLESAPITISVCVLELIVFSLFPGGESACMWLGISTAVLGNETPSAGFSWPCPCVVTLMSPRYQKHPL